MTVLLILDAKIARANGDHPSGHAEVVHQHPHDSPAARVAWNAVAATETILIGLLVTKIVRDFRRPAMMPQADTWVATDANTVCHIDGDREEWEAVVGENKYTLRPTTIDWRAAGCSGDVHCFKGTYPVGTFTLQKHPRHRNRLVLTIRFTPEPQESGMPGETAVVVANLKRVE